MNLGDSTITRVDIQSGATRTVHPSSQPVNAAFYGKTLWVPDPVDGTVTPLDARTLKLPDDVIRADFPVSVTTTADAVWVAAAATEEPDAPSRLYRIDPRTRAVSGRPVKLGPNVGWIPPDSGPYGCRALRIRRCSRSCQPLHPPRRESHKRRSAIHAQ